jgi:anti-anti-sigma regulatory factor
MKNEASFTVKTKKDASAKVQSLIIEGDIGVSNAQAIRAKLMAIDFKYDVNIQLINIETLDMAGIQIIYSLTKTLASKGLKSSLSAELNDRTSEVLRNTAFTEFFKA